MNKLKRILLSIAVALGFSAPALVPAIAHAGEGPDIQGGLNCGAEFSFDAGGGCAVNEDAGTQVDSLIVTAMNILSIVVGIVAVIMIIVGGFKYITSNGDSGAVSSAKNTILYAIVGLVIVALAHVVVRFVLRETNDVVGGGGGGGGGRPTGGG